MAPPADCKDCANDSSSSPPDQQNANVGVVLGVLGGLCFVALVVAVAVPLIRHRVCRRQYILSPTRSKHRYSNAPTSDIQDGMYLPSPGRPSSFHQKMYPGPDEKPLLKPLILDPLRPISALTWSDLRFGSNSASPSTDHGSYHFAHQDTQLDLRIFHPSDQASLQADRAQSSRSMSKSTKSSHDTAGAVEDEARSSLPSLQRSPTPPGLPSKRGSPAVAARRRSLPITPISPSDSSPSPSRHAAGSGMPFFAPAPAPAMPASAVPLSTPYNPLSPVSPQTPSTSNLARSGSYVPSMSRKGLGMEPVPEDADADEYAETRSLQLPSPPASPDQSDPRWSSSKRRPSLTGRQSAPNALPFRPRSSTGPSVALPLTAAFQTSVLRSGSGSSTSNAGASSQVQRYPSITAATSPPPRTRSRPSSVSVTMSGASSTSASTPSPALEADIMARPTEAFRRMSTSDVRHRQPYSSSAREDDPIGRAYLRSSNAQHIPEVCNASPGPSSHRHAMVYNPPPPHAVARDGPTFTTPPPNPLSPVSPMQVAPAHSSSAPRLSVSTNHHQRPSGMGSSHPPTVTWKSLASGSRASMSSQQSHLRDPTRSRSNSVRSTRTLPSHLPPLDPVGPLSLSLDGSPESDNEGHQ
ncbi:hypothetical protein L226DRAFT_533601 [Lentinus tigrinus ALCF2SS1-7]|uniref:Uncharacterized protein n=1 Tax=Lentinus tigrinus ALCF2SS1-6 TaxID=1328759 RepID=A0A5C2SKP7_9APHY|nr:hypothetical protein L227DRAFT_607986 [Lentinus tigrinus ALCF2SS1-6]RPD76511.1 hypothetical protein L226DRAFT_533601 [Lentinus tigrinus ALCF2SS1-7]